MGCSNAGGDWKVVSQIISETLSTCKITICEKAGGKERRTL